jgi:hypothetical protein
MSPGRRPSAPPPRSVARTLATLLLTLGVAYLLLVTLVYVV